MKTNTQQNRLFENLLLSFLVGWITSYFLTGSFLSSYTLERTQEQSLFLRLGMIVIIGSVFYFLSIKKYQISRLLFAIIYFGFAAITLLRDTNMWTQIGFCLFSLFIFWMLRDPLQDSLALLKINNRKIYLLIIVLIGLALFSLIAWVGILRHLTFRTADFDLGLFSQMFENMRTTGLQTTTIERDQLMSHFGVHVSPIFYLMLPIYSLVPSPYTLQIMQAFFVALSIWPLYLLCRFYKLSDKLILVVISLYALFPALSGSCFNDFHENCILPFLLFFLIWSYEQNRNGFIILFSILTFSVKEDAAIMVGCLAFYYILVNKRRLKATILFFVSVIYFFAAVAILNHFGDGMLGYMTNFTMNGKNGLPEIIKALILNPGYSLLQCFNLPEKLYYLFFLILPLGAGLVTKKYYRYILLLPFVLMNLMPDYNAVYSLDFQYHFGVSVFLFYLVIMNLAEAEPAKIKTWALLSVMAAALLFVPTSLKTAMKMGITYLSEQDMNQQISEALATIPEDVSVNASPKFVSYFYQYEEVYPITSLLPTDYVIFDRRPDMMMYEDEILGKYYSEGYTKVSSVDDVIEIYKKD